MNTLAQLILPSFLLPLLLSAVLFGLSRRYPSLRWGLVLIWLPSCFWLVGWPKPIPEEANDWLWLLAIFSMGLTVSFRKRERLSALMQTGLLGLVLIVLAWPVLRYQLGLDIAVELTAVLFAGAIIFFGTAANRAATPALTLSISSGGLALVTALGGSLLIGQLVGALASVLIVFAVFELYRWLTAQSISLIALTPVIQLYLALLVIARVYAEIPLLSAALLLAAPMMGLLLRGRFTIIGTGVCVAAALAWLLFTADSSSYY